MAKITRVALAQSSLVSNHRLVLSIAYAVLKRISESLLLIRPPLGTSSNALIVTMLSRVSEKKDNIEDSLPLHAIAARQRYTPDSVPVL